MKDTEIRDVAQGDAGRDSVTIARRIPQVISAASTTSHKATDAARSYNLCQAALDVAVRVLLPGGIFVSKIFQGGEFQTYRNEVGAAFDKVSIFKPQSSRKASKEIFIIGIGRR